MKQHQQLIADMPAFPVPQSAAWGGMTIRQYFAAKAIQGIIAANTQTSVEGDVTSAIDEANRLCEELGLNKPYKG